MSDILEPGIHSLPAGEYLARSGDYTVNGKSFTLGNMGLSGIVVGDPSVVKGNVQWIE